MAIDLGRAARELAEAALRASAQPEPETSRKPKKAKKQRLSTGRAMLLGAGLVTAGRALASSRGRHLLGSLQDTLTERPEPSEDEEYEQYEDADLDAEGDEGFADEDEPEAEAEAESDADLEDEPEGEPEDEQEEPEPEPPRKARRRSPSRGRA